MSKREIACALITREVGSGTEVLLEQRPATNTVMPGLWELPSIQPTHIRGASPIITVRHSIMQVNYTVHIRAVSESSAGAITAPAGRRQWVALDKAAQMPLTGLARKVLSLAHLLPAPRLASPKMKAMGRKMAADESRLVLPG